METEVKEAITNFNALNTGYEILFSGAAFHNSDPESWKFRRRNTSSRSYIDIEWEDLGGYEN